jgi:hypothetical protein
MTSMLVATGVVAIIALVLPWRRTTPAAPMGALPSASVSMASIENFTASITAGPGARWWRRRDGKIEWVHLDEGTLSLHVERQRPDGRFLVELPDGEIEVRGTRFEVTARRGLTRSVRVEEGVVVYRPVGAPEIVLHAGERWNAEAKLAASSTSPAKTLSQARERDAQLSPAADYEAAAAVYGAKRYAEAATRFSAFVSAHPMAVEAEDASFLEASALAHDGRSEAAAKVAEHFLRTYPTSFHARDAAVLVARDARNRGDCVRARAALGPWLDGPTPDVTRALGACIAP